MEAVSLRSVVTIISSAWLGIDSRRWIN